MAMSVGPLVEPSTANPANMNPKKRLPESPRKARAGGKLYGRKPSSAPARATATKPMAGCPRDTDTKNTATAAKKADPAATPSAPSSKLKALVIPTNHTTVTTTPTPGPRSAGPNGRDRSSTRTPSAYMPRAIAIWTASLSAAGSGRTSSTMPRISITTPPMATAFSESAVPSSVNAVGIRNSDTSTRPMDAPTAMTGPPARGTTGSRVSSSAPTRRASAAIIGVMTPAPRAATTKTSRYDPTKTRCRSVA